MAGGLGQRTEMSVFGARWEGSRGGSCLKALTEEGFDLLFVSRESRPGSKVGISGQHIPAACPPGACQHVAEVSQRGRRLQTQTGRFLSQNPLYSVVTSEDVTLRPRFTVMTAGQEAPAARGYSSTAPSVECTVPALGPWDLRRLSHQPVPGVSSPL